MLKNAKNVLKERMEGISKKEIIFLWDVLEYSILDALIKTKGQYIEVVAYRSDIIEKENNFTFENKDSFEVLKTINNIINYVEGIYYDLRDSNCEFYNLCINDTDISKKIKLFKEVEDKVSNATLKEIMFN